jgi:hypothetical protein
MMWILRPFSNGMMLERDNSYTYKTKDFMLSTAQNHHPGRSGDQEHIWGATLSREIAVFVNHPGTADPAGKYYWAGNARLPHSVQHRNVHMSIFVLPAKKAYMERELIPWTHLYFPTDLFDRTVIRERVLFGETGGTYVAVLATSPIVPNPDDSSEFFQRGRETCWICELGSASDDGTFEGFVERIDASTLAYDRRTLIYENGRQYRLRYQGEFSVDGDVIDLEYPRFDTPYVKSPRGARVIDVEFGGHHLHLDFDRVERSFD